MNLVNQYDKIIDFIVNKYRKKSNVVGIILFGSLAISTEGKHNDIDIHIITNSKWIQRKSFVKDGILVELFFNPIQKHLEYAKDYEESAYSYRTATGRILYEKDGNMLKMQQDIRRILKKALKYSDQVEKGVLYYASDMEMDIANEEKEEQKLLLMNQYLRQLLFTLYRKEEKIKPKDNYIIKQTAKEYPHIFKKVQKYFQKPVDKKFSVLKLIRKDIIGAPNPEWTGKRLPMT